MRADAQRNRERIDRGRPRGLPRAGVRRLARRGRQARRGRAGTLYRHFPSRDALLDAIMQSWVDRVNEAADKALAHEGSPRDLLLAWFEAYVALISLHKGGPAKITQRAWATTTPRSSPSARPSPPRPTRVVDRLEDEHALREQAWTPCRCAGSSAAWPRSPTRATSTEAAVRPLLEVVADGMLV